MRSKTHKPLSRAEFDRRFPDEAACAEHLAALRWPEGFVCPRCDGRKGWRVEGGRGDTGLWECAGCHRQTSVTAGTALHRSKLPLRVWFAALHIVTSHSTGISALQMQGQFGLGSYTTAWLLLRKIRAAMALPGAWARCSAVWWRWTRPRCRAARRTTTSPPTAAGGVTWARWR